MKPGTKKKPTVLRMRDNVRIKKVPSGEPTPALRLPRCPSHLTTKAKGIWKRMGKILLKNGLITESDESSFAIWCQAYADLQEAELQAILEDFTYISDKGNILANPFFHALYKLRAQVDRFGTRFGMSPSDRSGISTEVRNESNPYRAWQQGKVVNGGKKKKQKQ